jgi:hypothetical protein
LFIVGVNKEQQIEKEYRKTALFIIASKKIKYLGKNLTKNVNVLYKENYKSMKKEIEEDYRRQWNFTLPQRRMKCCHLQVNG